MITEQAIKEAKKYLSCDDISCKEQIENIINCDLDEDDFIDSVEGVSPTYNFEFTFTIKGFLEIISTSNQTADERNAEIIEQFAESDKENDETVGQDIVDIRNKPTSEHYQNTDKIGEIMVVLAIAYELEGDMNGFDASLFDFVN